MLERGMGSDGALEIHWINDAKGIQDDLGVAIEATPKDVQYRVFGDIKMPYAVRVRTFGENGQKPLMVDAGRHFLEQWDAGYEKELERCRAELDQVVKECKERLEALQKVQWMLKKCSAQNTQIDEIVEFRKKIAGLEQEAG